MGITEQNLSMLFPNSVVQ